MDPRDPTNPDSRTGQEGTHSEHPSYTPVKIGPYVLRETLGEGGMGVVYGAEQTEPVRREVALKVIKLGMDTKEVVARFEAERQALAVMEHPSIAKVFDAGATEAGQPYFVMERVRGIPIVDYCDEHRLTIRERVRLFVQACLAVQHAHQKGVIHRDLKPSNILITEADGKPLAKIIDFGIAKAAERPLTEQAIATTLEQIVGTPAYTSPEQTGVAGVDVDTRTDVYALGVTLYELLTGALPFDTEAYAGWARLATAMEREPPRPSRRLVELGASQLAVAEHRRTDASILKRDLRGDLDWIVMKAIEKDRDHRYETAESLATELVRYLDDEAVLARPPSARYRMGKFTRRHKVGVVFTATLSALLVGVTINQTIQAELIREARDLADARRGQAEGVLDFMLGDLWERLEPIGRLEILGEVGDQALAYFETLPEEEFSDQELTSRSQALYQIGLVRLNEGKAAEAVPALRESLRLARELSAREPGDPERLWVLSQSYFYVGQAAYQAGDLAEAETQFQAYLETAESLVEGDEENFVYRLELAYAYSNIGSVRQAQGDLEAAAEAFASTVATMAELARERPDDLKMLGELAESHNLLAVAYRRLGQYDRALEEHSREYELKTGILGRDPTHAEWRSRLATAHFFIGVLQRLTGDVEGAVESQEMAGATLDSLVAYDPTNTVWRQNAAGVRREAGLILGAMGRREESLRDLRASVARFDELARADSAGYDWGRLRGTAHSSLARSLLALGEPAAALVEAEAAAALLSEAVGEGQDLALARNENELVLGHALFATGRETEARETWNRALTALRQLVEGPGGTEFRPLLAEAYLALDRGDEARRELQALRAGGYGEPYLIELATERGIIP